MLEDKINKLIISECIIAIVAIIFKLGCVVTRNSIQVTYVETFDKDAQVELEVNHQQQNYFVNKIQ